MKLLHRLLLVSIGLLIGFAFGRGTIPVSVSARAAIVNCYDSHGNLVPDEFQKLGGARTACAPGQTTKVR